MMCAAVKSNATRKKSKSDSYILDVCHFHNIVRTRPDGTGKVRLPPISKAGSQMLDFVRILRLSAAGKKEDARSRLTSQRDLEDTAKRALGYS